MRTAEAPGAAALDFFAAWGRSFDACCSSFHQLLADDCVWDQRPVPKLRGPHQAVRFLRITRRVMGLDTIDVEILNVATSGNTVHVERIDHLRRRDGSLIASAPVVGVMTFSGDRVVHWREYFDSAEFTAQALRTSLLHAFRRARGLFGRDRPLHEHAAGHHAVR